MADDDLDRAVAAAHDRCRQAHPASAVTDARARHVLPRGNARSVREVEVAELSWERFASIEHVRFTNSAIEANLMVIGTAKHAAGRPRRWRRWLPGCGTNWRRNGSPR